MKNGGEIAGANSNSYSISKVTAEDSGSYSVIVNNVCGSVVSSAAALTVNSMPSIRVQPQSQLVCEGSSVTLSVEATGTEPLSYQWMANGESIAGAITNTYTIPHVSSGGCNCYSVMVSNSCGSVESDIATLTLKSGPSIQVQPLSQVVCMGSTVDFNVNATGTEPLSYQWKKNGADIAGANADTYTIPSASAGDAGSFSVIVSNCCGSVESSAAALAVNSMPLIQTQPLSQETCSGSSVAFSVEASGTEPIVYQWKKDGVEIPGANSNNYSIESVSANDAGGYSVMISNACGSVESSAAALAVNSLPLIQVQPLSQVICSGSSVAFSIEASGTEPIAYQWKKDGVEIPGANSNNYSIESVSANDAGGYSVMISNACGSVESSAAVLAVNSLPSIQIQPLSQETCSGSSVAFSIEASGTEPIVYQWKKDGVDIAGATTNTYSIPNAGAGDSGSYSVMVINGCGSAESNAANLKVDFMPSIRIQPLCQEVCLGSPVTISVEATGTDPLSYQWKKDGENITGASSNIYSIPAAAMSDEGCYSVVVSNGCGSVESNVATLNTSSSPSILVQPSSQVACEASAVAFGVEATGTGPLFYQWKRNGENITGANTESYSIPCVSSNDEGSYSALVSNKCGSVESDTATLAIISMPSILVQPLCQEVCTGSPVTFSVEATGTGPLAYQWKKNNKEIPGANSNTYTVPCLSPSDEGCYRVVVYNSCGWVESDTATLAIRKVPCIVTQPIGQASCTCTCKPVTFSVTATGPKPLYYQWMKDGMILQGATSDELKIYDVTSDSAGEYSVVVTNDYGSVESNAVTLKVDQPPEIARKKPTCQVVHAGDTLTMEVEATGTGPLSYQWMKNGLNISDATSATYTLRNATKNDTGNYRVLVSNSYCSVESNIGTLKIAEVISKPYCR